ncbi:MAG: hypothetical protein V5A39_07290 [Haloarculaceae archaeon]
MDTLIDQLILTAISPWSRNCSPETRGDWSWTKYERDGYAAFHNLLAHSHLSAPEFQPSRRKTGDTYYELSFPVEVEQAEATAGGGSTVIAPAVALPESNADSSDGRGPAVQRCIQFRRCTTESY